MLLFLAAAALGQLTFNPTPLAVGSLLFQSMIVSFASFLVWFALLRRYLASQFGIVIGAWLLNEQIEPGFLTGAAFVLAGIVLVSGCGWIKQGIG